MSGANSDWIRTNPSMLSGSHPSKFAQVPYSGSNLDRTASTISGELSTRPAACAACTAATGSSMSPRISATAAFGPETGGWPLTRVAKSGFCSAHVSDASRSSG